MLLLAGNFLLLKIDIFASFQPELNFKNAGF